MPMRQDGQIRKLRQIAEKILLCDIVLPIFNGVLREKFVDIIYLSLCHDFQFLQELFGENLKVLTQRNGLRFHILLPGPDAESIIFVRLATSIPSAVKAPNELKRKV